MNLTRLRSLMSRCIWLADMLRSMFAMFFSAVQYSTYNNHNRKREKKIKWFNEKRSCQEIDRYCSQHGITVYFYTFKLILYNQGFPASS